jgi:hypothetical protein
MDWIPKSTDPHHIEEKKPAETQGTSPPQIPSLGTE